MVRFSRVLTIGAFLLAGVGCTAAKQMPVSSASTHDEAKPGADDAPTVAKVAANDTPDPTLYPDEYEARGMPSIQDPWTPDAHKKAAEVLVALFNENPALLPRLDSKHSGPVFRRMVSRENIEMYANRDMEPNLRMSSIISLSESMPVIMTVYNNALIQRHPVDRELLEVSLYATYLAVIMWEAIDDQAANIYHNDALLPQRLAGIEQTQAGAGGMLRGLLLVMTDRRLVRLENQIWFVSELVPIMANFQRDRGK